MVAHRQLPLHVVMPRLKNPIPDPPVERPVRGFSDCKEGGSFGALRSLGLVGVALREDELNGWGELVGVVLVVLAQENNFIVGLAGAWRCSAAAGAGTEGAGSCSRSLWGRWRSWACRSAAFRASSAARPAGPPAFQRRDWRASWAAGAAGAAGETDWLDFRDATLDDEATSAWLH